ncbi:MAG: transcription-repair coupling factor [Planctomycetia bacterium]|nr:transcription-repair coupling factor [Planctomycetia bacterium]
MDALRELGTEFSRSSEFEQILTTLRRNDSVSWNGCVGSAYALLASQLIEHENRPLLVVISNVGQVDNVVYDIASFTNATILPYPLLSFESAAESSRAILSEDVDYGSRLKVFKALDNYSYEKQRYPNGKVAAPVVVASLAALLQPTPSRNKLADNSIRLEVGMTYDRLELIQWLLEGRFARTHAVELSGEFSERGYLLDVFAVDMDQPVRIEFFGDQIETIRRFDVLDQRSVENLTQVEITRPIIDQNGAQDAQEKFTDRLPKDAIVLFLDFDVVLKETLDQISLRSKEYREASPDFPVDDIVNSLLKRGVVCASSLVTSKFVADTQLSCDFTSAERFCGDYNQVVEAFNSSEDSERIVVVCSSETEALRLQSEFESTAPSRQGRLFFPIGSIHEAFEWREANVVLIGSDQLLRRTIRRRSRTPQTERVNRVVDSFLELKPGELVVHVDYGIARYLGVETKEKMNQREDCLKLEFAQRTYVYVPASQIRKIQRYFGSDPRNVKLASIDGKSWNKKKLIAQKEILEYARDLIETQAQRQTLSGVEFPPDGEFQHMLESFFPYRETDDQLVAIAQVKADMESPRPMDRLLCGDVGFGKTEVAIRAAFKAIEAGYQVAVLAPTTVLAEQHYHTFSERMRTLGIKLAALSRYCSAKEKARILDDLKEGRVDIVIGTHSIVQKSVVFKKLGLLVIDEEQKFGVGDKERLKSLYKMVDVLTMSATPIPRTLHLSLMGVRDISTLTTPPVDRLPVQTKVISFDRSHPDVVRNAILREINRGGQVYYLYNRVATIERETSYLRQIVPEASIQFAHAQMPDEALQNVMRNFILKKFNVLVSTTIVENGLDIPNANTIFICNADQLGLAELHQLRGRVGREKRQAYCYLLVDAGRPITLRAQKRLQAIKEYDKLGSGYQIAMKDLEIRGAGNIVGRKQSGHIAEIGYEMYCDFLEAAVRMLKRQPQKMIMDVDVDLPINVILPDSYIADSSAKINFYRRFDRVRTQEEILDVQAEMVDRFGKLPVEARRLVELSKIRVLAFNLRIRTVSLIRMDMERPILELTFRAPDLMFRMHDSLKSRGVIMNFADSQKGLLKGYVHIPRDLFERDGKARPDSLLKYVSELLDVNILEEENELEKQYGDREERLHRQREQTKSMSNASQSKAPVNQTPLLNRVRALRQDKRKEE